jgi:hypothetical protein
VLPALLFARTLLGVARNRTYAGRFALTWPVTLAQLSAWSCGELLGYLAAAARPGSVG